MQEHIESLLQTSEMLKAKIEDAQSALSQCYTESENVMQIGKERAFKERKCLLESTKLAIDTAIINLSYLNTI